MAGLADVKGPMALHPAFYGSYDWHSSVHGHWMLARLLRLFPGPARSGRDPGHDGSPPDGRKRQGRGRLLCPQGKQVVRAARTAGPGSSSWPRSSTAGDAPDAKVWAKNLRPLADVVVSRYLDFLPKQTYPIRTGVHPNTAFGLAFAHDYARSVGDTRLIGLVEERARTYFGADADVPAGWEPGGADFFSPSLMEADLMRRVLPPPEFRAWFGRFLPGAATGRAEGVVQPSDRDRPDRPATGPPRRAEPEPGVVHAEHRRRSAGRRPGPSGAGRVGSPSRRGGTRARRQRRLCRRALAGLVRRLPALDSGG